VAQCIDHRERKRSGPSNPPNAQVQLTDKSHGAADDKIAIISADAKSSKIYSQGVVESVSLFIDRGTLRLDMFTANKLPRGSHSGDARVTTGHIKHSANMDAVSNH